MAETGESGDGKDVGVTDSGRRSGSLNDYVKAESMIQLAIALPAGCVIGWFGGSWLDHRFHQHWIGVLGIVLGAIAGFLQMYLLAARYLRRGD